jgi:hypothetical protein
LYLPCNDSWKICVLRLARRYDIKKWLIISSVVEMIAPVNTKSTC